MGTIERKGTTLVIIDAKETSPAPSSGGNHYWDAPTSPEPTVDGIVLDVVAPSEEPAPAPTQAEGFQAQPSTQNPSWEPQGTTGEDEDEDIPGDTNEDTPSDSNNNNNVNANNFPSASGYDPNNDEGVLASHRLFNGLRRDLPQDFRRAEGSNVDVITLPTGDQYAFCHISTIMPFTQGDFIPWVLGFEDGAAAALAVQHLNEGNGVLVPEVEGLPDRCRVRFTNEWADTQFQGGVALSRVVEQVSREEGSIEPRPCAFNGAYRSAVSIPMSIVTGLFGYPQITGASTSADLDDPSQYPLFGRTIPADSGNAISIIRFLRETLNVRHLAVLNVNDAYGNALVNGLRKAAETYAPDMILNQVPLDEGEGGIPAAVTALANINYRYIFAVVFTAKTHDELMREATLKGMAGTGKHTWLFGDSFAGVLDDRTFPADGVLHKAYRGSSLLEVTGGIPGVHEKYDTFRSLMREMHNPTDLNTLADLFPDHNSQGEHPEYNPRELYLGPDSTYLLNVTASYSPFLYEAVIGLGLAACEASNANPDGLDFDGQQHFEYFKNSSFTGFSGPVKLNEFGSRRAEFAMYKVTNFQAEMMTDENGDEVVRFAPRVTHLFENGNWSETDIPYIFNDGTTKLPPDLASPEDSLSTAIIIIIALAILCALGIGGYIYLEHKKKENDSVWEVDQKELKFSTPPEIIGRGTFGLVLLAEYRGTQVAVKRVIPPKVKKSNSNGNSNEPGGQSTGMTSGMVSGLYRGSASGMVSGVNRRSGSASDSSRDYQTADHRGLVSQSLGMLNYGFDTVAGGITTGVGAVTGGITTGIDAVGSMVGLGHLSLTLGKKRSTETEKSVWRRMKREFIEEMRYLSKLRHPCITTVMGAVTKGEPMLVMEYMDHGSLYDLLHNETMAIEGELILPLLKDITQGLRFLHFADPQVIHGDLKAQNILVDSRFRAKVADFGLSQKAALGGTGTPYWMAPELLRKESPNTDKTDIYSFGIILFEVFSRRDPYEGEAFEEVLRDVADPKIQKRPPAPRHMPEAIKVLMKDCVDNDPDKRPACDELDARLRRIDADSLNQSQQNNGKSSQVSLFDIFPRHIAEALRDGRTVEAEHKDCVTIFFSDIVGFTDMSAKLDPKKVAGMLDRLYTKFDTLSQKHDIFKVETIGDAYMAVTSLVKPQDEDHTARIAQFAIDAIQAANSTPIDPEDESLGFVNIRVGFHSGPVVADVVGTRNPRYCLFGDTVNTASRMESNSEVNRIHCSRAAARLLHQQNPEIPLRSRGKVEIKGKGTMHTYWVNEQSDKRSADLHLSQNQADSMLDLLRNSTVSNDSFSDDEEPKKRKSRQSRKFSTLLSKVTMDEIGEVDEESMELSRSDQFANDSGQHRRRSSRRSHGSSGQNLRNSGHSDGGAPEEALRAIRKEMREKGASRNGSSHEMRKGSSHELINGSSHELDV